MEIAIAPEVIFSIGDYGVTNSMLSAVIITVLVLILIVVTTLSISAFKPGKIQLFFEYVISSLSGISESMLGKASKALFPFLFTFFIIVVLSNWFGLLPFVGPISVIHHEQTEEVVRDQPDSQSDTEFVTENTGAIDHKDNISDEVSDFSSTIESRAETEVPKLTVKDCIANRNCYLMLDGSIQVYEKAFPFFRAPTSDVSATIALALISVIVTNILGFNFNGFKYIKKYFNFSSFIDFVVGLLELISEIGKIFSFTFRLFGNIFAGEVLLLVITSLSFGIATLPFMGLEVFVGFIQGFVFFMLTTVFIGLSISHEH